MYDVKQYDPKEWSAPPLEGRIVDRPGVGKIMIGRGTTNTKGPQMAFLAALHAFKAAKRKLPINLVLVCEGEEEIGSPNFKEIVFKPEVEAALRKSVGIIIPLGNQALDGSVEVNLGAKGIVELELVSSGEKWGRGPTADIHSSLEAQVDSPVWRLVQALNTLVKADGHTPAVEGFFDDVQSAQSAAEGDPGELDSATQRGRDQEGARRLEVVRRRKLARLAGPARHASPRSTSKGWSAATPGRAARRSCRIARSPRSTCAWCPT